MVLGTKPYTVSLEIMPGGGGVVAQHRTLQRTLCSYVCPLWVGHCLCLVFKPLLTPRQRLRRLLMLHLSPLPLLRLQQGWCKHTLTMVKHCLQLLPPRKASLSEVYNTDMLLGTGAASPEEAPFLARRGASDLLRWPIHLGHNVLLLLLLRHV